MRRLGGILLLLIAAIVLSSLASPRSHAVPGLGIDTSGAPLTGIHKIKHVVMIMQENRSFDSYFGTFPGADGIPIERTAGSRSACPDRRRRVRARRTTIPPTSTAAGRTRSPRRRRHQRRRDGRVRRGPRRSVARTAGRARPRTARQHVPRATCMGYHDAREIPNYWTYAENFVLQDHMFEPVASWSLPAHLYMVSGWSARCTTHGDPSSCRATSRPTRITTDSVSSTRRSRRRTPDDAWTDITYLLHKQRRQLGLLHRRPAANPTARTTRRSLPGQAAELRDARASGTRCRTSTPCRQDGELGQHPVGARTSSPRRTTGTLPAVSWVMPSQVDVSEHPPASVSRGPGVRDQPVNSVMRGPDWGSTAIFLVVGRLGRLLRPRRAAHGRRQRLRPARARRS